MSDIIIVNPLEYNLTPEDMAMLQALYSRSDESVRVHLEKVKASGSGKFMSSYYVGYGHDSIADTANVTVFLEGVSLMAAKAIQETPLYNGQECSTRYIDFSNHAVINPFEGKRGCHEIELYHNNWLKFYTELTIGISDKLKSLYPCTPDIPLPTWDNAIKAATFDICRAFLPVGITTNLSFTASLRQMREHIISLFYHPLKEVSGLAKSVFQELQVLYPNTFQDTTARDNLDAWNQERVEVLKHLDIPDFYNHKSLAVIDSEPALSLNLMAEDLVHKHLDFLNRRPRKGKFPREFARLGSYTFRFRLDYGSYRDLQRHRDLHINSPLFTGDICIHDWYLDRIWTLDRDLYKKTFDFLEIQNGFLSAASREFDIMDLQYLYPLGQEVDVSLCTSLPELVYVIELRSNSTVHPTLRRIIKGLSKILRSRINGLVIYEDTSPINQFCVYRGNQVIYQN